MKECSITQGKPYKEITIDGKVQKMDFSKCLYSEKKKERNRRGDE